MRILITGAAGFVGRALAARIRASGSLGGVPVRTLRLLDTEFPEKDQSVGWVEYVSGSIAARESVRAAWEGGIDILFHLASIPGGAAEQNYTLARDVNILGTMELLEAAKEQSDSGGSKPIVVFASTIAVFGSPLPARVDDTTALNPQMTYASQKLIGETLVADFSRRGWLDGRSLRLAGVLARPPARTGQLSAFLSDMIRELSQKRQFTCPMSPECTTWAVSIHNIVDNLMRATVLDSSTIPARRTMTLPAIRFSMAELVEAISATYGDSIRGLIRYVPNHQLESLFGRFPLLETGIAEGLGFRHDGDLSTLVRRAIEPTSPAGSLASG